MENIQTGWASGVGQGGGIGQEWAWFGRGFGGGLGSGRQGPKIAAGGRHSEGRYRYNFP